MSGWRIKAESDDTTGRVNLLIIQRNKTIGVINVSWQEYVMLCRTVIKAVNTIAFEVITESLGTGIWKHALSVFKSEEKAKNMLLDFGWNKEVIEQFARGTASSLAQRLVDFLPEA